MRDRFVDVVVGVVVAMSRSRTLLNFGNAMHGVEVHFYDIDSRIIGFTMSRVVDAD